MNWECLVINRYIYIQLYIYICSCICIQWNDSQGFEDVAPNFPLTSELEIHGTFHGFDGQISWDIELTNLQQPPYEEQEIFSSTGFYRGGILNKPTHKRQKFVKHRKPNPGIGSQIMFSASFWGLRYIRAYIPPYLPTYIHPSIHPSIHACTHLHTDVCMYI